MTLTIDRLESRFERYLTRINRAWGNDPTIEASFRSDFETLIDHLEQGDTTATRAGIALTGMYEAHLPSDAQSKCQDNETRLPNKRKKAPIETKPNGTFYKRVVPGVIQEIDAPIAGSCGNPQLNAYGERRSTRQFL